MNPYLILILGFLIGTWLLGLVVEALNLHAALTRLPEEFAGFYDPADYSHPPVLARIRAIGALAGVAPKGFRSPPPAAAAGGDPP